jgi:hypothetical protein
MIIFVVEFFILPPWNYERRIEGHSRQELPRTMLQFKDDDDIHKAVVCVQEVSTAAMPLRNNNDNTRSTSTPVIAAASVRGFAVPSTADELHHAKSRWSEESWQFKALRYVYISMLYLVVLI